MGCIKKFQILKLKLEVGTFWFILFKYAVLVDCSQVGKFANFLVIYMLHTSNKRFKLF